TVCSGDSITLIGPDASSYSWSLNGVEFSSERIPVVHPSEASTYVLSTQDTFGCAIVDSVFVDFIYRPTAHAGEDILACYGQQVSLNALGAEDSLSYLWTPGFPFLEDPFSPTTQVLLNQDAEYTLLVTNGICADIDTVSVTFYDGLEINDPDAMKVCLGDSVNLQLDPAYSYNWTPAFINFCQDDSCTAVQFLPTENILFDIVAEDAEGCLDTLNFMVSVNDTLTADTTVAFICPGDSILWEGTWYDMEGSYCVPIEEDSICQDQKCLNLFYYTPDGLNIIASDTVVRIGDFVDFSTEGSYAEYNWQSLDPLDCINCPNPTIQITQEQWIYLEAIDDNGCLALDSIFIRVLSECIQADFMIPNAFTPNKNNANDRFRVVGIEGSEAQVAIEIYARWGELLFEGFDNTGWDGQHENEAVPEGVYLYLIRVQCPGEESILYKGDVTLIR
ncbi:MAG: T9SS type B sorting domain-containing protein, partial [Saprospiraceae bacterium]|nr:T9SS type B sorting domain-containing protein [Saprospiraceae bacterium]